MPRGVMSGLVNASRRRLAWAVGICFAIVTLTSVALSWLPAPATVVVIEGRTEYLQYNTFNPQLSAFPVDGFRVAYADDEELETSCLVGTFTPDVGSSITYIAREPDPFLVSVAGTGGMLTGDSGSGNIGGEISLFADPTCAGTRANRFPVWGPGRIGSLFTVRNDGIGPLLLSGTMSVFGRTLDLGVLGEGGALYTALSQPFTLLPGGTIWTDGAPADLEQAGRRIAPEQAALFGFVSLDAEAGMGMRLTTETPILQVHTPGGSLDANRIEIGIFAQILNDPNILRIQVTLLLFFFLLPIAIDLLSLLAPITETPDASQRAIEPLPEAGPPGDVGPTRPAREPASSIG